MSEMREPGELGCQVPGIILLLLKRETMLANKKQKKQKKTKDDLIVILIRPTAAKSAIFIMLSANCKFRLIADFVRPPTLSNIFDI